MIGWTSILSRGLLISVGIDFPGKLAVANEEISSLKTSAHDGSLCATHLSKDALTLRWICVVGRER